MYDFIGSYSDTYKNYIIHGGDIAYQIYNGNKTFDSYGVIIDPQFAYLFRDIWINFAIYGVPNSSILLNEQWKMYNESTEKNVFILGHDNMNNGYYNVKDFYNNGYRNGVCDFWVNDIGWDIMVEICLDIYSLQPTISPTITPVEAW